MSKKKIKFITFEEALTTLEQILSNYEPPTFMGSPLFTKPEITEHELAMIFEGRKRMDVEKLTQEIAKRIAEQIK